VSCLSSSRAPVTQNDALLARSGDFFPWSCLACTVGSLGPIQHSCIGSSSSADPQGERQEKKGQCWHQGDDIDKELGPLHMLHFIEAY
jgi:hypothetical protein